MRSKRLFLVLLVAAWFQLRQTDVLASPAPAPSPHDRTAYCGDGICQSDGCDINGNETPGNGCRETESNCPDDCASDPEPCSPIWEYVGHIYAAAEDDYSVDGVPYCDLNAYVVVDVNDLAACPDSENYQFCGSLTLFTEANIPYSNYCCDEFWCGGSTTCPL